MPLSLTPQSRWDNTCRYQHTSLNMRKEAVRSHWLELVPKTKDLITISHGIFGALQHKLWEGRILACDIDPGVRNTINNLRHNRRGESYYPDLRLEPPGEGILDTTHDYCRTYGVKSLGAVDIDLTACVEGAWEIAAPVVQVLQYYHYKGLVLLTFADGRRCSFKNNRERMEWLRLQLPTGVTCFTHEPYRSTSTNGVGQLEHGHSMCLAALRIR